MTRSVYDVWAIGGPDDFEAKAYGHRVGEIVFNQVRFSPAIFRRGRKHLRGEGKDFLVLEAQLSGGQLLSMDHGVVRMLPGHIYLRDWAHGFESTAEAMALNSVIIPRHRLKAGAALSARNSVLGWSMSDPLGRLLATAWVALLAEFEGASLAEADNLTAAFLGFLDGLLGYSTHAPLSASLAAMEQFLTVRLQGEVGVRDLCEHFRVSRSTVYRLFEAHGGVRSFVGRQRLYRCHGDLSRADPERMRVGDVASSWGFFDASAFSRAFRREFGKSPSTVLGSAFRSSRDVPDPGEGRVRHLYGDYKAWLREAAGASPSPSPSTT